MVIEGAHQPAIGVGHQVVHVAGMVGVATGATKAEVLGNLRWWREGATAAVSAWLAFLVLTIAGERLELSRFVPMPRASRVVFGVITILLLLSAVAAGIYPEALKVYALALLLLAGWLLRYDIARRTVRGKGLTRYMAVCLLSGYLWLGVAAALGLASLVFP